MKVLFLHNYYQQPGGEDQSFAADMELLESHGHQIVPFTIHNDAIRAMGRWELARKTFWNHEVYRRLRALMRRERPDVMHCRNTFPLISPAAYYAARAEGVPVVQTLCNYRLLCPGATLHRRGKVCEDCVGKRVPWPALVHACYRRNRAATALVAGMLAAHRAMRTWSRAVNRYITLTDFARRKAIAGGLPADRISVRPNLMHPDPGAGEGRGDYAVFAGRLSEEKGLAVLLEAWSLLSEPLCLKIVGDGPLADQVRQATKRDRRIEWLGHRPFKELLEILGDARFLVSPSTCYETFGRTVLEAYAKGTPALVSRGGATAELVEEGRTGILFQSGNPADLAAKIRGFATSPAELAAMRQAARQVYQSKYNPQRSYQVLMDIYRQAMGAPVARVETPCDPDAVGKAK